MVLQLLLELQTYSMEQGVYTAFCGDCEGTLFVHIDENGEFPARKCNHCKAPFDSIEQGEDTKEYFTNAEVEETEVPKKKPTKKKLKKNTWFK